VNPQFNCSQILGISFFNISETIFEFFTATLLSEVSEQFVVGLSRVFEFV
jgi:hypothetical protein